MKGKAILYFMWWPKLTNRIVQLLSKKPVTMVVLLIYYGAACQSVGPGFETRPRHPGGPFAKLKSNEEVRRGPPYISALPVRSHKFILVFGQYLYRSRDLLTLVGDKFGKSSLKKRKKENLTSEKIIIVPCVHGDLDVVFLLGVGFAGCSLHKSEAAPSRRAHKRLFTCTRIL